MNAGYTRTVCVVFRFDLFCSVVHKGNTHNAIELLLYLYPKLDGFLYCCSVAMFFFQWIHTWRRAVIHNALDVVCVCDDSACFLAPVYASHFICLSTIWLVLNATHNMFSYISHTTPWKLHWTQPYLNSICRMHWYMLLRLFLAISK